MELPDKSRLEPRHGPEPPARWSPTDLEPYPTAHTRFQEFVASGGRVAGNPSVDYAGGWSMSQQQQYGAGQQQSSSKVSLARMSECATFQMDLSLRVGCGAQSSGPSPTKIRVKSAVSAHLTTAGGGPHAVSFRVPFSERPAGVDPPVKRTRMSVDSGCSRGTTHAGATERGDSFSRANAFPGQLPPPFRGALSGSFPNTFPFSFPVQSNRAAPPTPRALPALGGSVPLQSAARADVGASAYLNVCFDADVEFGIYTDLNDAICNAGQLYVGFDFGFDSELVQLSAEDVDRVKRRLWDYSPRFQDLMRRPISSEDTKLQHPLPPYGALARAAMRGAEMGTGQCALTLESIRFLFCAFSYGSVQESPTNLW
ncbi:hypothetical protein IscW_ISCW014631 [Ixodes scapularis]|uniref:Uncharacterized protein n=1 Tax=Ixodes scapularis TaxID=6945 RepID=B7QH28_IXOSC|nr:hypothetical protein IscW_ISCW014631 [Ixodes scapularis]|eukprot:XP_002414485.1 hypothetical protein IscW_ISCW014631 [Ixodes scapularis]